MILSDSHVHSSISPDSKESLENIARKAEELGLKYVTITEHYEIYPASYESHTYTLKYLENYNRVFHKFLDSYTGPVDFGFGIELGEEIANLDEARKVISYYDFDFVLSSLHNIDGVVFSHIDYRKDNHEEIKTFLLKHLEKTVHYADFDVLAHLDLPKRYAARQGVVFDIRNREKEIKEIVHILADRGKGIEINTSNDPCMPEDHVVDMYLEEGGRIITSGSDAHDCSRLAHNFNKIPYKEISAFRKRKVINP